MAFRVLSRVLSAPPRSYLGAYCRVRNPIKCSSYGSTSEDDLPQDTTEEPVLQRAQEPSELYRGMASMAFSPEIVSKLEAPLNPDDVEIKLDGLIYLPEIKYRRILNQAFGPGGWALMPLGEALHMQNESEGFQLVTREYLLYCHGRFVAQAMGEHTFYSRNNLMYGKACESAKSNALMRCCKDLGVASSLWDPQFIDQWKAEHAEDVWCENVRTKERKRLWRKKKNTQSFPYPWKQQ
ncbi:mitochondrial genome maintenance protein mgm101 homolog [Dysidea avara]|uniref:mitochondrial genome maintenance protein mgm101 homolog n=1 Tax=Dysidea avara TaxID=196820 RepID=UPI00332F0166